MEGAWLALEKRFRDGELGAEEWVGYQGDALWGWVWRAQRRLEAQMPLARHDLALNWADQ